MEKATLHSWKKNLMGSPFLIQAYIPVGTLLADVENQVSMAFAEIKRLEDLMTDFRKSPVTEINDMAGIKPVRVNQELFNILAQSLLFSKQTLGAFDITYAAVGHLWREASRKGIPPHQNEIDAAKKFVGYEKIKLNLHHYEVFLPEKGMKIGLGGIGKGYAVDAAYSLLKNLGLKNFVVNGAGDIRAHSYGETPRPWRIGVRNPLAEKDVAMGCVEIANGAIATSGDYERFFRYQGKKYHHVLDARSGEITEKVCSATVLADSSLVADVYATSAMALGPVDGIQFLQNQPGIIGFLVTNTGEVVKTNRHQQNGVNYGHA